MSESPTPRAPSSDRVPSDIEYLMSGRRTEPAPEPPATIARAARVHIQLMQAETERLRAVADDSLRARLANYLMVMGLLFMGVVVATGAGWLQLSDRVLLTFGGALFTEVAAALAFMARSLFRQKR